MSNRDRSDAARADYDGFPKVLGGADRRQANLIRTLAPQKFIGISGASVEKLVQSPSNWTKAEALVDTLRAMQPVLHRPTEWVEADLDWG